MGAIVKLFPVNRAIGHLGWNNETVPAIQSTKNNLGFLVKASTVTQVGGPTTKAKSKVLEAVDASPVVSSRTVLLEFPKVSINRYEAFLSITPEMFELGTWSLPSILSSGYSGSLQIRGTLFEGKSLEDVNALSSHLLIYLID
jgi:hypothetical protein